ncbi:M56 family metallopeptidase [Halpernia frigidisoli]|uniref:BlaR1 peptidase M56 n=1 Tax=Halpernia frigidisoli TaxID=1125876 RepID=A0A1I3J0K1_9FLAO|nr:M56 family metallopeptidase [Halpernia frigidisoli]SFI53710.1 BlaR1 peptidase M56 [Halpernia frigidisoli]
METLLIYFGKMILCSGVMFGYYFVFLKDKTFHHYNRFYLLSILFLSIFLPLIKIDYFTIEVNPDFFLLLKNLQTVSPQNLKQNDFNIYPFLFSVIGLVSVFFILKFLFGLIKIQKLKVKFPKTEFEGIKFYETPLEDAPFSFFRNLFWKDSIELQSDLGRQILKHEMVHIEQKHTWDKIIMSVVNSLFWFNPIFHLIKKEIFLIHEYLADKKTVKQSDTKAFAQMLLASHFTGTSLPATSPFLSSNLKKRIIMLKKSHTKFSYLRKISALPIVFFLAFAYLVNAKNREINLTNQEISKAVSKIKNDTIKPTINVSLVKDDKGNFEDKIIAENDKALFKIGSREVIKAEYLKYYRENKNSKKAGFYSDKIKDGITVFGVTDLKDSENVSNGNITKNKQEIYATTSILSDTDPKLKNTSSNYTVTSNYSENLSINPLEDALKNTTGSDTFRIDSKEVSKSEFEYYYRKNYGQKTISFGFSKLALEEKNGTKHFYAVQNNNLALTNAELKAKVLEQRKRAIEEGKEAKFKAEAARFKAESADLAKTVATENLKDKGNPNQNNPWILKSEAPKTSFFENKNVKYYVDGKLVEGSTWKEILPENIKQVNVVRNPGQKNGGIVYIVTKDSPLENIPTQFDRIYINGKAATQNELFKLSKDSIETQNIKKNNENGKSFNEIRITTK